MNEPSELHQTVCLSQLAEVKRTARRIASVATDETIAAPSEPGLATSPWQFRLRSMLVWVAALSGLFAVMHLIGAVWSAMLVWFLILAFAHVTANFWGTHVAPRERQSRLGDPWPDSGAPGPHFSVMAGAERLRESRQPGWPMLVATVVGALVGGMLGALLMISLRFDHVGYSGVVVGTVSAAIVGGFLGFLTGSFAVIASRAWGEALSGSRKE
ncbi:MAG TPA: hypothetical protein VF278_08955 [Pirellulales bacterium]